MGIEIVSSVVDLEFLCLASPAIATFDSSTGLGSIIFLMITTKL